MEKVQTLRDIIAELSGKPTDKIGPDLVLTGPKLKGSVGRGALDAAIRRKIGVTTRAVYTVRTYGELEAAVLGTTSIPAPAQNAPSAPEPSRTLLSPATGLGCGVDIEMIDNMPTADDFWTVDFYRGNFTDREIAYCVAQDEPRLHFAARWCAKESLRKCATQYASLQMSEIEVVTDQAGRPLLSLKSADQWLPLPVAVSLTHTTLVAAAIVVCMNPGDQA